MNIRGKISTLRKNKDARALASNFVWLSILKIAGYIFPFITMPYLARVIGVTGFGEIAFATSVIVFLETFTDFGFNYTATRDIARCREDRIAVSEIFSNVLWAKLLLMTIAFGVLCILVFAIPSLYEKRLLLFLTFLYIPGHILFPDWFFQAMEDMKYITILNVVSKVLFTALVFVVIKEQSDYVWQPMLTAIGYWVSGFIAMIFVYKRFNVRILTPVLKNVWHTIKDSANMFVSLIFPNLYTNFSTILLRSTCGEVATGLYDAGARFITLIDQLFDVLSRAFYPFLSRRIDKHTIYVYISGIGSVLASLFLFFGANLLIKIFYTAEFADAATVIRIMSVSPIALFLMRTYGVNYLVLVGKDSLYRNIILFYSIIGLILTLCLTPIYGYIGMAITIAGVWVMRGVTTFLCARRYRNIKR
ncbi:MAG: flippase [Alistipes sp.]|nr:flippase [Alistipes sp.]